MKPSETICPASVATMDELWPDARSASAKRVAAPVPSPIVSVHVAYTDGAKGEEELTLPNDVLQQIIRVKEARRAA